MDMMLELFKTIFDRPENVKKLREIILDLAVKGKLVEQDPNDEPASVLVKKIKEEKERLVNEKKIKKEKPLAKIIEEEKPFELPSGWEFIRLGELGNIFNGNSINAKIKDTVYANIQEGYNYISTKDVKFEGREIEYNTGVKVPYDDKKFKVAHAGAVLICSEGGSAGRKIGLIDREICFGNKLYAIEPFKGELSEYIFYTYQSKMFFNSFASKMKGIIGGISIANFKEIIIPICSLNEQRRIVERVSLLMSFCDKLEKVLEKKVIYRELTAKSMFNTIDNVSTVEELEENLKFILLNFKEISLGDNAVKELRSCILQLAVQGKLVSQHLNDEPAKILLDKIRKEKEILIKEKKIKKEKCLVKINEEEISLQIPQNWELCRFGEVALIKSNLVNPEQYLESIHLAPDNIEKGTGKLFKCRTVKEDEVKSVNHHFYSNQIIYSKIRPNLSKVVLVDFEGLCSADMYPIEALINIQYLHKYMLSKVFLSQVVINDNRVKMPKINQVQLNNVIVPIPPLEEQKRIVKKVNLLMKLCDELEKKVEKQKVYSNRLMESIVKNIM